MELQYKNSEEELFSLYKYNNNNEKILKRYKYFKTFIMIPISLIISVIILLTKIQLIRIYDEVSPEDLLLITAPIFIGIIWCVLYHFILKILDRDKCDDILKNMAFDAEEDIVLKVAEEGLEYSKGGSEAIYYWNYIKEVVEQKDSLYIVFNNCSGIVIPASAFEDEKEKKEFVEEVNKRKK